MADYYSSQSEADLRSLILLLFIRKIEFKSVVIFKASALGQVLKQADKIRQWNDCTVI